MRTIHVETTYLEMLAPPLPEQSMPLDGVNIVRIENPRADWYRNIYQKVGKNYSWYNRLLISEVELQHLISKPGIEIYVLTKEGLECGYAELDCCNPEIIELVYFGVIDEYHGKGLGKFFLNQIIEMFWMRKPKRLWLHTCALDHPAALVLYQKAGFKVFEVKMDLQLIP